MAVATIDDIIMCDEQGHSSVLRSFTLRPSFVRERRCNFDTHLDEKIRSIIFFLLVLFFHLLQLFCLQRQRLLDYNERKRP